MEYQILMDSCGEVTDEMKSLGVISSIPLTLQVGDTEITDDETFNQTKFIELVASTDACPRSACPSPELYKNAFSADAKRIYIITLSANLSGSYNSAVLAKSLAAGKDATEQIHIFNSCSASVGQTLIARKVIECEELGKSFEETVEIVEKYIDDMNTVFVLEDLSFLQRNGRLTGLKYIAASLLHILPILAATPEGTIYQLGQARGAKKAMAELLDNVLKFAEASKPTRFYISYCNSLDRAEFLRDKISEKYPSAEIKLLDMRGVSTMYAGNRGIIVAF
ncbi:MAG: DegV family protein [Lachnospiraceae bacterium]|nr:DegV family protein [Lachnospiraceae bacterium]